MSWHQTQFRLVPNQSKMCIFRIILPQAEFCLKSNQSEKVYLQTKYGLILQDTETKFSMCTVFVKIRPQNCEFESRI